MFGKLFAAALLTLVGNSTFASDESLEPCINGGVSPSGSYPSETIERGMRAYVNWRTYEPYYLFAVSADYLQSPFGEQEPTDPTR